MKDLAMTHFDALETRSADQREADHLAQLNAQIARVAAAAGACRIPAAPLQSLAGLAKLPVLRKSDLTKWQKENPPFGGIPTANIHHIFQSPGPIYEPGGTSPDWWRMGRFSAIT
jgi:phenylacetate-CoA ligase